jgi:thiol-disulfide isomerase/thioredoxin
MQLLTVLLRIALSAVFGIAGVTKLLDPRGTRDAVKNFGSPDSLAPALSIALPIAELAVAVGLLFTETVVVSSLAALVLLAAFVLAIGLNLARGRTHDCHCFGQLYSRPLGWPTLARNVFFALGAGFVLWQTATETEIHPIPSTLDRFVLPVWWGLFAALAVLITLWIYLRRRKQSPSEVAAAPRGLPIDSTAPPFELTAYAGGTRSLAELIDYGKPVLLIFTNPTCGPCVVLFAEIKEWQQAHSDHLTIALISFGTIKENFVNVARNGLGQVLLQQQREVAEKYGANVTPTAVLVNTNGRIASPVAAGADEIRALLATVVGTPHGPNHHHHHAK